MNCKMHFADTVTSLTTLTMIVCMSTIIIMWYTIQRANKKIYLHNSYPCKEIMPAC